MKHFLLAIMVLVVVTTTDAQFTKGTFLVGGSFSEQAISDNSKTNSGHVDKDPRNELLLTPQAGYFLTNHFAAGTGLSYLRYSSSTIANSPNINFIISPFVRYYFHQFFAQATYVYQSSGSTVGLNGGLGYVILLNTNVALEPQAGYTYTSFYNATNDNTYSSGIYLKIAIQLYIHR